VSGELLEKVEDMAEVLRKIQEEGSESNESGANEK